MNQQIQSPRIYTKCPACGNDTLTINEDKHLLCTWIDCKNPTLIDNLSTLLLENEQLRDNLNTAKRILTAQEVRLQEAGISTEAVAVIDEPVHPAILESKQLRKERDGARQAMGRAEDGRLRASLMYGDLEKETVVLRAENSKLTAFKTYVHKRLDEAGVPVDPDSPHKAEGCRIGGRLDWVLGKKVQFVQVEAGKQIMEDDVWVSDGVRLLPIHPSWVGFPVATGFLVYRATERVMEAKGQAVDPAKEGA